MGRKEPAATTTKREEKEVTPTTPNAEALAALLKWAERNTCQHEETYRGGAIWTICRACGQKWADDEGGFKGYVEPPEFEAAREALAALSAEPKAQAQAAELTNAARDVLAERQRQIEKEGWTPKHDDEHNGEEMALAAVCYLLCYAKPQPEWLPYGGDKKPPRWWPWDEADWKPKGPRRDLVRAGALILAELERLDRASSTTGSNT